jgi:pimeloyl-ACP methyl ester carboxylesterase
MHHVVLVPGFFGFGALGKLNYFDGVSDALAAEFARRRLTVDIVEVPTLPTASIRHRAASVLETLAEVCRADDGPLHVIAHSTGGLDARLAIAPTASLPTSVSFTLYERICSLVTISTPHFGTPLASVFSSAMGYPLLRAIASLSISALERGRLPLGAAIRLGKLVFRLDDWIGLRGTFTDQIYADLLEDFTDDRRKELITFLEGVSNDQSLVFQLTPAGCDLLNACTADPTGVRYGCVVTRAVPDRATGASFLHLSQRSKHRSCEPSVSCQAITIRTGLSRRYHRFGARSFMPSMPIIWTLSVISERGGRGASIATGYRARPASTRRHSPPCGPVLLNS